MCDKQPVECASFTVAQCSLPSITNYCPSLCGLCSPTPATTTTTTTTTTTMAACGFVLPCMNGGSFNTATCSCSCYPSYTGIVLSNFL